MRAEGFRPYFSTNAEILILGSFPSVKSRETSFYYGHPRNRFWRVLAEHFGESAPISVEDRKAFVLAHRIALWDIVVSCEISGSADASIRDYEVADVYEVLNAAPIRKILVNGSTAAGILFKKYPELRGMTEVLPSTSPANARFDKSAWEKALGILKADSMTNTEGA